MKKSLGFPTNDLHRSPRKSDVRYLSSIEPSVPKNIPSSPWLNRTQTNEAQLLWSSFETKEKKGMYSIFSYKMVQWRLHMERADHASVVCEFCIKTYQKSKLVSSALLFGRCKSSLCSPTSKRLSWRWLHLRPYHFVDSYLKNKVGISNGEKNSM